MARKWKAIDYMLHSLMLFAALSIPSAPNVPLVDSPDYFNKAWRDSAAEYRGRVEAYHQEFYSYDLAMTFAIVPVAGEWYVDKMWTGIGFSIARTAAVATAAVGGIRLIGGKSNTGLNIGLLAGGIIGYFLFKWWEISDVMHTVSHRDEDLVEKWRIATPDIAPGSIRYPTKEWPPWVTAWPESRHHEQAREAVDKPLPVITSKE
jgi:hypothetical protein